MKKHFKKVLALALSLAVSVPFLAACGGNNGSSSGTTSKSDDKGSSASTLKVGVIGPLTGDAAVYGNAVKNGAQLAIDEINNAGGVNGVKLELYAEDDVNDTEKAVNAYNALKDKGMQILLGTVTSQPCISVEAEAKNDNIFLITPSATTVEAIDGDNAFRVCFSDPDQGTASATYIADKNLAKKIAVIYDSSISYSSGIYDNFQKKAKELGLEVVAAESFTGDSKTDFSTQIQKVKSSGAELLFLPIYYQEASLILQQAKTAGLEIKYFGCDGLDGLLTVKNFDTSLAENVMLLTPFSADAKDEKTQNFVKSFKEKFGDETLNQFAADAYDGVYAIKAAAEKSGVKADMSASDICDAMKKAMTDIKIDGLTGTGITWSAEGEPTKAPKAVKIVNGAYTAMD
ncbi:MAG: ABC transporter substrate-binding protein [Clostridia bacterium]|nr:ABC transporter substrate-binding protein [Clostridia bacterium]